MKAPWKPKPDTVPTDTFFCPCCRTHVLLLGEQDIAIEEFDHLADLHRPWLLGTYAREVISRETR